ncbi:MAG: hypothetical protein KAT00_13420 [Planctomycetes bacterium]|nr:hypothetical protein [Planctomycetota bacterium]
MSGLIFAFLISIICVSCYQAWSIRHAFDSSKRNRSNALHKGDLLCKVDAAAGVCREDGWTFSVMIRGKVTAPFEGCDADVRVLIEDVTQRTGGSKAVLCSAKQWQMADSTAFCLRSNIGKLARKINILSDWTSVATVESNVLEFAKKGKRKLNFIVSIISVDGECELARTEKVIVHRNEADGYIDTKQGNEKVESLTVELAAGLCFLDGNFNENSAQVLRQWITMKTEVSRTADQQEIMLKFDETIKILTGRGKNDIQKICKGLKAAAVTDRFAAMELCMQAVGAFDTCTASQRQTLKQIGSSLAIDDDKFRAMSQKILPVAAHDEVDIEFVLGVNEKMATNEIRSRLNEEYRKWNGRVTHADAAMQNQAGQMLDLIADARAKFVEACV